MTPEQISTLLELVESIWTWIVGGGLLAILGYGVSRFKAKTERTAAVAHGSAELVSASNELVATLIGRIDCLEGRVLAAETRIDAQEQTITVQTSEISLLRTVIAMWSAWWMDLEARWPYHRLQDAPPPRPLTPAVKETQ